jgi:endonuclease YncB( thermonuclease family)
MDFATLVHRSGKCQYIHDGTRYHSYMLASDVVQLLETIYPNPMTFFPATCNATVTRVVDGDTYCVEWDNKEFVVRIIGCDCFETRYSNKLRKQAVRHNISMAEAIQKGRAASGFATTVLLGEVVTLSRPDGSPDNDMFFRHLRTVSVMWNNKPTDFATLLRKNGHDESLGFGKSFDLNETLESRVWHVAYSFE